MSGRIRLDATKNGIVIVCRDCPYWYAFRFEKVAAWESAREHEKLVHPGAKQATAALAKYRDTPKVA